MTDHTSAKVLILDDDEGVLRACERVLKSAGHTPLTAVHPEEAMRIVLKESPDVLLLDVKLGEASGLDVLREIKEKVPDTEVIMMTAYATLELAVEAVKAGAYDFLTKPFESNEKLLLTIERAMEKRRLVTRTRELETEIVGRYCFDTIIGKSPKMQEVFTTIRHVAPFDLNVLIQGDSGTGKELVARALHYSSMRRERPFVAINCAALTESLIESELFGHERGAFTGAVERKKGLFEAAHGGTIFLDEIGEMPLPLQSKLLRVLETGEIRRVGGTDTMKVNVRVVSASNKDLAGEISQGKFREDLYYRLNVVSILLPSLKERAEDVPLLIRHFLGASCKKLGKKIGKVAPPAMEALLSYPWPGNVRELENAIERAVALSQGEELKAENLPGSVRGTVHTAAPSSPLSTGAPLSPGISSGGPESWWRFVNDAGGTYQEMKERIVQEFDRIYLSGVLKKTGGNISLASQMARMDRSNFKRLLRKSGLRVQ